MKWQMAILCGVMVWVCALLHAAEVGAPVEVSSQAKESRNQTWASVGWCEGAKRWLAAWREGYLNESVSDIWCARLSADSSSGPGPAAKALDPTGIRLTSGAGVKDRPRVASDGKGFLVVWEEMRNGKDWDVYGARVSSDGVILDAGGFLIAGGEHNQCRADAAFAKGNYFAVWMGLEQGAYGIYGRRISSDGKMLDDKPAAVAAFELDKKSPNNPIQALLPVLSANRDGELLSAFFVADMYRSRYLARRPIDAATGQPAGSPPSAKPAKNAPGMSGSVYKERTAGMALGTDSALAASRTKDDRSGNDISLCLLSKTGEVLGIQELGSSLSVNDPFKPIQYRPAVVFDGKAYLLVSDSLGSAGGDKKKGVAAAKYARILGWRVGQDGKLESEDGFAVAGEAGRECLLPAAAAGPEGVSMVVYSEARGVDDVKVLARIVK